MDYLIPGCSYPISALALMFPPLSPARYARLLASIRAHGLRRPIVVWRGQVIDGLHRLKACLEAGVEPRYEFLDEGEDPFECLADENISLRNMTQNDKARLAYDMSQYSKPGRPRATDENSAHVRSLTQGEAAELVGVSKRLVSDASRVLSEDSTAVPALQEAVRERLVGCRDAAMVVDQPREVQIRGMELMAQTEVRTIKRAVERVEREIALAEEAAALADMLTRPPDETVTLHTSHGIGPARPGDSRQRGRRHQPPAPYGGGPAPAVRPGELRRPCPCRHRGDGGGWQWADFAANAGAVGSPGPGVAGGVRPGAAGTARIIWTPAPHRSPQAAPSGLREGPLPGRGLG